MISCSSWSGALAFPGWMKRPRARDSIKAILTGRAFAIVTNGFILEKQHGYFQHLALAYRPDHRFADFWRQEVAQHWQRPRRCDQELQGADEGRRREPRAGIRQRHRAQENHGRIRARD